MHHEKGLEELTERLTDPGHVSMLSTASLAGTLSASLIAKICSGALDGEVSGKAEDGLREIHDQAIRLRRDLVALIDHSAEVDRLMIERRSAGDPERLRELLFASEITCRIAASGHTLQQLALKVLGRVGLKGIGEVATASGLAFAAVVGAVTAARSSLSEIAPGDLAASAFTREKAERILREADSTRAHITERVLKHLP